MPFLNFIPSPRPSPRPYPGRERGLLVFLSRVAAPLPGVDAAHVAADGETDKS